MDCEVMKSLVRAVVNWQPYVRAGRVVFKELFHKARIRTPRGPHALVTVSRGYHRAIGACKDLQEAVLDSRQVLEIVHKKMRPYPFPPRPDSIGPSFERPDNQDSQILVVQRVLTTFFLLIEIDDLMPKGRNTWYIRLLLGTYMTVPPEYVGNVSNEYTSIETGG